jgi:hypothetical protein
VSKYEHIADYGEFELPTEDEVIFFACCDCGLVHTFVLAEEKRTGRESILIIRDNRRTAQLRRHEFGDLHRGDGRWRLVRNEK